MAPRFLFSEEPNNPCIFSNCSGICVECSPPSAPLVPDVVPIDVHHKNRLLPNFLIAASSLLALSFLLLLLFYLLFRLRRRRRRLLNLAHQPPPRQNPDDDLIDDDDDDGPHHVWYIRTVGLDDSVIKSIATTVYKGGDGLIEGGDCTVCLGEFEDGELIKLLPKCTHAFHLSCIDTWLKSHVNCPLCRTPVVAPVRVGPDEADGSGPSENTQNEIPQPIREECPIAIDLTAGSSSSTGPLDNLAEGEDEVQPIRRSVSMDSSSLGMLMLNVGSEPEEKLGEEKKELGLRGTVVSKNRGKEVDCLGKQGVGMKRSLSSRSGRLFFSRYGRGRSASVLPL